MTIFTISGEGMGIYFGSINKCEKSNVLQVDGFVEHDDYAGIADLCFSCIYGELTL